ncbi:hypothetical protein FAES_0614 [Fibrella aestuarina BUZ 2]|uniref:Capsule assembly protein Wzi n=1 Tax=Fibrella aestuarina BUZ 2 TaxID=1166018 RepID=I0K3C2_9BACT|nr:capsule assembly Wzi family protein [Fibrella aestuarina]CCG98625.1 hypothetical protein FAES_0614 [Fibrella aestuarina BUZ 2]
MRLLYLAFLLGLTLATTAQSRWHADAEVGGLVTTDEQTPLWLRANQWGAVPVKGSFGTLRATLRREYATDSTGRARRFDWGAGLYGVLNQGIGPSARSATTYLPDAYVKLRWGGIELWGGNRREVVGLGDTLLSSGFVIWSGNALPFPKVQLHTPDFVPLPFTKGFVAFRAGYAHGWFANTYVKGSYLHQKYAYLRLGKPNARLHVTGGLNHQVQWAGYADYLLNSPIAVNGQLPSTLRDYWYVISGSYPEAFRNDRLTEFDGENRVGNHIGSIDFSVDWRRPRGQWQLYHQHIYEDASGLAFQNVPDGLTGLRYQRLANPKARFQVRRVTVEWLCTTDQTDDTFDFKARFQGADNYFNHAQYRQGWSYRQRTIGSPLMVPVTELGPTAASYENSGFFPNNRLIAWYGAVQGGFTRGPSFTLRGSFSRGFGTFAKPYPTPTEQVSASLALQWPISRASGLLLTTAAAIDRGTLLPVNSGGYISLSKHW